MNGFISHAERPAETKLPVTPDRHDSLAQAQAVCTLLESEGLGGNRRAFPTRTWVTKALENTVAPPEFKSFSKIARFSRRAVITEKIDGTNAVIHIDGSGQLFTGSRNLWITPEDDNFGFAAWAQERREELLHLGPGFHFGEWWGRGIQRSYDVSSRRFSLFNTERWCGAGEIPLRIETGDPRIEKFQQNAPACCRVVPRLWKGSFDGINEAVTTLLNELEVGGSVASPGFCRPEGIVICHVQSGMMFKKTLEDDGVPKSSFIK